MCCSLIAIIIFTGNLYMYMLYYMKGSMLFGFQGLHWLLNTPVVGRIYRVFSFQFLTKRTTVLYIHKQRNCLICDWTHGLLFQDHTLYPLRHIVTSNWHKYKLSHWEDCLSANLMHWTAMHACVYCSNQIIVIYTVPDKSFRSRLKFWT